MNDGGRKRNEMKQNETRKAKGVKKTKNQKKKKKNKKFLVPIS